MVRSIATTEAGMTGRRMAAASHGLSVQRECCVTAFADLGDTDRLRECLGYRCAYRQSFRFKRTRPDAVILLAIDHEEYLAFDDDARAVASVLSCPIKSCQIRGVGHVVYVAIPALALGWLGRMKELVAAGLTIVVAREVEPANALTGESEREIDPDMSMPPRGSIAAGIPTGFLDTVAWRRSFEWPASGGTRECGVQC